MKSNTIVRAMFLMLVFSLASCAKKEPAPQPAAKPAPVAAPAPVPAAKKETKPATVADIQAKLIEHGAKLKSDGKMGAKTKTALKKFQAKNGLKATGVADRNTLSKLGLS